MPVAPVAFLLLFSPFLHPFFLSSWSHTSSPGRCDICHHHLVKPISLPDPYSSKERKDTLSHNTLVCQSTRAALTLERRNVLECRSRSPILQTKMCFSPGLAEAGPMGKSHPAVGNFCTGVAGLGWLGSTWKFFVKSGVRRKCQIVRLCQTGTAKSKQQQNHQIAEHMLHASPEDAWIGLILLPQ